VAIRLSCSFVMSAAQSQALDEKLPTMPTGWTCHTVGEFGQPATGLKACQNRKRINSLLFSLPDRQSGVHMGIERVPLAHLAAPFGFVLHDHVVDAIREPALAKLKIFHSQMKKLSFGR